jgi:acetolactate synthase regulatory subunit
MILDELRPIESDQKIFTLLLQPFPGEAKNTDGRSWLPMHFATALGNKITEDDIHEVHSADPLSIQRYNLLKPKAVRQLYRFGTSTLNHVYITRYTPCHFLCMQRHPNMSLVKYLSMRDLRAFSICAIDESSYSDVSMNVRNAIQLAAASSESIELLRILLQIDQSMMKKPESLISSKSKSALGYLCERSASQFSTFNGMLECLMTADSSSEVLNEGILSSFESNRESDSTDIKALLALIESLLEADNDTGNRSTIFRSACSLLDGELCIAVLSYL